MRILASHRAQVGESAFWDAHGRKLWWVDVWGRLVLCLSSGPNGLRQYPTEEMVGAVVASAGGALAAMETGLFRLPAEGRPIPLSSPPGHPHTHRFNDATVDPRGRLIVGTMKKSQLGAEASGMLYTYAKGAWRVLDEGFWTVNGLAFAPDGRTLYVSDSHPSVQTIWARDYDPETGETGPRRVFATMDELDGRPDGAAVDAEGGYWIAGVGGGCVYRFTPEGKVDRRIDLPVESPTKVAFGDPDLRTLYVTSMSVKLGRPDPEGLAGSLLAIRVEKPGLALPRFAG